MANIDVSGQAPLSLRLGDDVCCQRNLTRRTAPAQFDHAAPRQPADAEREVQGRETGGDNCRIVRRPATQFLKGSSPPAPLDKTYHLFQYSRPGLRSHQLSAS